MQWVQKVPYVCFYCRVAIKRETPFLYQEYPNLLLEPKRRPMQGFNCPCCHNRMAFLGRYFKVPPHSNLKQWKKAQLLWENGWCADGYSVGPKTMSDAKNHLRDAPARAQKTRQTRAKTEQEKRWRQARRRRVS